MSKFFDPKKAFFTAAIVGSSFMSMGQAPAGGDSAKANKGKIENVVTADPGDQEEPWKNTKDYQDEVKHAAEVHENNLKKIEAAQDIQQLNQQVNANNRSMNDISNAASRAGNAIGQAGSSSGTKVQQTTRNINNGIQVATAGTRIIGDILGNKAKKKQLEAAKEKAVIDENNNYLKAQKAIDDKYKRNYKMEQQNKEREAQQKKQQADRQAQQDARNAATANPEFMKDWSKERVTSFNKLYNDYVKDAEKHGRLASLDKAGFNQYIKDHDGKTPQRVAADAAAAAAKAKKHPAPKH